MKDIYIPKRVPRIEVREKLHGHTRIDLFNTKTKKYERVEHDNTFTDGIESYFRDLGLFCNSPYRNGNVRGLDLCKTTLGGIYLFDTELPTSPMAKYMPAGTTMTANGSYGVSNAGNPQELGSFNGVESVFTKNSATFVYDWLTSQGNGTIASVALGTRTGGYIGYGNASVTEHSSKRNIDTDQTSSPITLTRSSGYTQVAPIIYGNRVYVCFDPYFSNPTSITIYSKIINTNTLDLFENTGTNVMDNFSDSITFTFSSTPSGYYYIVPAGKAYPSKFLLLPETFNSGATAKIYLLDVLNGSIDTITVTNNTGVSCYRNSGIYLWLIDDTYAIMCGSSLSGTWYKINYRTSAVVGAVANSATSQSSTSGYYPYRYVRGCDYLTDELMCVGYITGYLYDPVLNRMLPTNGNLLYGSSPEYSYSYLEDSDCLKYTQWTANTNGMGVSEIKNPLRLMTINNLDSPVTKTADKTMKVTYTITRAS